MNRVTFEIDKRYFIEDIGGDPDYTTCVSVCDYGDIKSGNYYDIFEVVDQDEIVTKKNLIRIRFEYPLCNPVAFEFKSPTGNGFTRLEFFKAVFDGYTQIYKTEEKDDKDPGMISGMTNRAPSEGRYGIWGHIIEDLYLEGIIDEGQGNFSLAIGS